MAKITILETPTARAAREGRTMYVNQRAAVPEVAWKATGLFVLKPSTNGKVGKIIRRGPMKGFRVFTLTLEERATCPSECGHWSDCYGNNMLNGVRIEHGAALEAAVARDVATLARKYPQGFMVRLHILGEFYSVDYVNAWRALLAQYPALHVYGYTHRSRGKAIGDAIAEVKAAFGKLRFRIRWSDDFDAEDDSALTNDDPRALALLAEKRAFLCPEQTGKSPSCVDCQACWLGTKPVVFITH